MSTLLGVIQRITILMFMKRSPISLVNLATLKNQSNYNIPNKNDVKKLDSLNIYSTN